MSGDPLARLAPAQRALLELRLERRRAARAAAGIGPRPAGDAPVPLSFGQQRLWFVDQMESGSSFFNICAAVRLEGRLAAGVLRRALGDVVRRHESLRTVFVAPTGAPGAQPLQRVLAAGPPGIADLPLADLTALPVERREPEAQRLLATGTGAPLDLARGPLLRAWLMRLGPETHVLACVVHHVIADWWSLGVLVRDVAALYAAAAGRACPLPELPVQYPDFALWQRETLDERRLAGALEEWLRRLAGAPSFLPLPTDFPRPAVQSFRGAEERTDLPAELVAALRRCGQEHGCTLFMVVVALYGVLLHWLTGETDLVVSAPLGGRDRRETEDLIGMFVDTLLLRLRMSGNPCWRELLGRVREVVTDAYERRHLPCDRIIRELAPERSLGYSPMLQAGLNLVERDPLEEVSFPGLAARRFDLDPGIAQFELNLVVARAAGGHWLGVQYRTDLFRRATARGLLAQLRALFDLAVRRPDFDLREARELLAGLEERRLQEERRSRPASAGPRRLRTAAADRPIHRSRSEIHDTEVRR
ncbi:MAG TPA: condensation domain-containing protein [Thermoanaerobaculia bacterium]|nr:condensation domain-containing protein [Thermoanaerobaculia bacterium]